MVGQAQYYDQEDQQSCRYPEVFKQGGNNPEGHNNYIQISSSAIKSKRKCGRKDKYLSESL